MSEIHVIENQIWLKLKKSLQLKKSSKHSNHFKLSFIYICCYTVAQCKSELRRITYNHSGSKRILLKSFSKHFSSKKNISELKIKRLEK